MERFYKSQPVTYHGGTQNATVDTPPQRTTQSLRITEVVDCRAHTATTASRTLNDPCKENSINVEEIIQPGPSNTEILNNQALFQTHLEEIDHDLGTLPTVTGEVSKETMHGKDGLNTDTSSSQAEEAFATKTARRVQNHSVTDSTVPIQDAPGVKGQMHTLDTWKRVTDKTRPMDTRESSSAKSGPKRKSDQQQEEDRMDYEKRMKMDEETWALGQLMAHNFGSAVVAAQHRWVQ